MTDLIIRCLGGLTFSLDGEAVTGFHSSKTRALLCYVAVTATPHTRSALAGLLWGDLPEKSARANLRKALSNLRQLVGAYLSIGRYEVAISVTASLWLDVAEFEKGVQDSKQVPLKNDTAVTQAVDLYKGEFLHRFDLHDAPEFEVWMLVQRARLREQATYALDALVRHYTEVQVPTQAILYAKQLIAIEPWREESHRHLMQLLAQIGERSAALMQYETCRQMLETELGVEPSQETLRLYNMIRHDKIVTITLAEAGQNQPSLPDAPDPLPSQAIPLIGREADLAGVQDLLLQPDVRLVTIVGAGGMGKTHLAVGVMAGLKSINLQPLFKDGIYFVSLTALPEPADLIPAIAQAVHFSFRSGDTPQKQLLNYLRSKQLLLVMDNYEHLLPDITFITGLLQQTATVKLLITSRLKLNVPNEYLYPLAGLSYPEETAAGKQLDLEAVQAHDAVQLFVKSGLRMNAAYVWQAKDWSAVLDICQLTGGMPLALILAAAWMEMLTPTEIANEIKSHIESSLEFITVDRRDLPDRHRSMRAIFDSSWHLLQEEEKLLFMKLAIFRGGFTHQAAETVIEAPLRELMGLVSKSFLQRLSNGRFAIHELLRQYAAEQLDQAIPDQHDLHRRHSAYFCADLQAREAEWKQGQEVTAFKAIAADFENMRAAWRWAANHGQFAYLGQAMESLGEFYCWEARYQEGEASFAYAVDRLARHRATAEQGPTAAAVEARLLIWQAEFNREYLGQQEKAVSLLAQAEALLEHLALLGYDIRRERAFLLLQLSRVARDQGDHTRDKALWPESLRLSKELGDYDWVAYKTAGLGWNSLRAGNYDEAYQFFTTARAMWQEQGNTLYLTNNLAGLSKVALMRGNLAESEALAREGMAFVTRTHGKLDRLVNVHFQLGETLLYSGKFAEAQLVLEEGIQVYTTATHMDAVDHLRYIQALVLAHMGRYAEAYQQAKSVYIQRQSQQRPAALAASAAIIGHIALAKETYNEAEEWLTKSLALYKQLGWQPSQGLPLALLAVTQQALGHSSQAMHSFKKAHAILLARATFQSLIHLFPITAYLLTQQGQLQPAVDCYALAAQYEFVAKSRWFKDVLAAPLQAAGQLSLEEAMRQKVPISGQDLWVAAEGLLSLLIAT